MATNSADKRYGKYENHNKSGHTDNCSYVKGEFASVVSKLTYRTSTAMLKLWVLVTVQQDNVNHVTIGCGVFIIPHFHSLISNLLTNCDFFDLENHHLIICVIHGIPRAFR